MYQIAKYYESYDKVSVAHKTEYEDTCFVI